MYLSGLEVHLKRPAISSERRLIHSLRKYYNSLPRMPKIQRSQTKQIITNKFSQKGHSGGIARVAGTPIVSADAGPLENSLALALRTASVGRPPWGVCVELSPSNRPAGGRGARGRPVRADATQTSLPRGVEFHERRRRIAGYLVDRDIRSGSPHCGLPQLEIGTPGSTQRLETRPSANVGEFDIASLD